MCRAVLRSVVLSLAVLAVARAAEATTAADLCAPAADPCEITTSRTIDPGSVLDFGIRTLLVRSTGRLVVSA